MKISPKGDAKKRRSGLKLARGTPEEKKKQGSLFIRVGRNIETTSGEKTYPRVRSEGEHGSNGKGGKGICCSIEGGETKIAGRERNELGKPKKAHN